MSLFDKDIIGTSPVTAETLRQIIEKRRLIGDLTMEERCNRILNNMYERVVHNVDEDTYTYDLCPMEIGVDKIFTQDFEERLNKYYKYYEHHPMCKLKDVCDWVSEYKELAPPVAQFRDFFKERGFTIYFDTNLYIERLKSKSELIPTTRLFKISWRP